MSYDAPVAPALFDILARRWSLTGPVSEACFNRDGGTVAFSGGGAVALAPVADPERPETRMRVAVDTARRTIQPRKNPVRPVTQVGGVAGPLAPFGRKSFIAGGADRLVSITPRGQTLAVGPLLASPATALAADPASSAVAACGLAGGMDFPSSVAPFILRGITLYGIDSVMAPPELRREAWARLARDLDAARLEMISREIALEEAIAAAPEVLAGRVRGRLVVDVAR